MPSGNILILRGEEVQALLDGREQELLQTVETAYVAHSRGESSLPHSTFLNFPNEQRNRIIALPAYLGEQFAVAGLKWISSFPDNVSRGMDRASAVVILNSSRTGQPEAIIEGSVISAKRTAASAALAARHLAAPGGATSVSMIGCGLINFEIARFIQAACPQVKRFHLFDIDRARAERFGQSFEDNFEGVTAEVVGTLDEALGRAPIVSLATTAVKPHIADLSACAPDATILHISLRDLVPEVILRGDNVVDDLDHVCRAQTSIHLAEQLTGSRDFVRCTLADVLTGAAPARAGNGPTIFSPFGLGVLDLAVSKLVRDLGVRQERGTVIESFLPKSWSENGARA
jgi:N-[(2S)-2-amino-2-carboxyethyl]-L-glutamate dehydrogenase